MGQNRARQPAESRVSPWRVASSSPAAPAASIPCRADLQSREPRALKPPVQRGRSPRMLSNARRCASSSADRLVEDRWYASVGVPSPRSRWLRRPVRRSLSLMVEGDLVLRALVAELV